MPKIALLIKEGFEESECLQIVDVMRRSNLACDLIYFDEPWVISMHGLMVKGDRAFTQGLEEYDVLVVPGGRPGGQNLLEDPNVLDCIRTFAESNKWVCGMCSGTVVLEAAGVITGNRVTGYTGYEAKLVSAHFQKDVVVVDGKIITSQGPATALPFAFQIVEALGMDTKALRSRMLYDMASGADILNK
jgi:4-methyl-5(b-hydroxyethyl)-thiazole monophosphate biosynthesis